ncbi:MAG: hypothetical protein KJ645_01195, partial [Planctomycetes bacterium]|nr:hypothetical protein [Planctomycetota bacterium]
MVIRIPAHKLAFSSRWLGERAGHAESIVEAAAFLELSQVMIGQVQGVTDPHIFSQYLKRKRVKVVALENPVRMASGEICKVSESGIADPQPGDREESLNRILETARIAKSLGANKVILRLGCMKIDRLKEIHDRACAVFNKEGFTDSVATQLAEGRETYFRHQEAYLDRAIRGLFALQKR